MNPQIFGRLRVIKELALKTEGISLSIGCKEIRFGDITVDIDYIANPDVVTDTSNLHYSGLTSPELREVPYLKFSSS